MKQIYRRRIRQAGERGRFEPVNNRFRVWFAGLVASSTVMPALELLPGVGSGAGVADLGANPPQSFFFVWTR